MNILEILDDKKKGKHLSKEQIEYFVEGLVNGGIKEYQASALLMAICINGMDDKETFALTDAMLNSGDILDFSQFGDKVLDKHSTGGVGDTTSLVLIPLLMSLGYKVAKMSGRGLGVTGGTLDKLESIKGFDINLDNERFVEQVNTIGGAIIGQTAQLCPADKILYALRDATSTIDSIPLIAASIMSKKIAGGAKNLVIDVKCGEGAFMKDIASATQLGDTMMRIAHNFGIKADYILSNMNAPLGDYIGNALEVFGAIEVLNGVKNNLSELVLTLGDKMLSIVGEKEGRAKLANSIASGSAIKAFERLITAQGGDGSIVDNPYSLLTANCKIDVFATKSGYISMVDATKIGKIICEIGGGRLAKEDIIDYGVGVRLLKRVGDKVEEGQAVAALYFNNYDDVAKIGQLQEAFAIVPKKMEYSLILR